MKQFTNKDLEKALLFSISKHDGQIRSGNKKPYIFHPISVANILFTVKESRNIYMLAICALLHDTVEDTNTSYDEIRSLFGSNVAAIVEELTSDKEEILRSGKAKYLSDKMNQMSSYAFCVKLCDRLDNLRDSVDMNEKFRIRIVSDTNQIINNLDRKLTRTHIKLIRLIKAEIKKLTQTIKTLS